MLARFKLLRHKSRCKRKGMLSLSKRERKKKDRFLISSWKMKRR